MKTKKKILYIQTSGVNTPERLYTPLILAQTALAMDIEPTVYFLGLGLTALQKKEAEKVKIGAFPKLSDVIQESVNQGVKIIACQQSMQLFEGKLNENDFFPEVIIAGAATLNDLALEADAILTF